MSTALRRPYRLLRRCLLHRAVRITEKLATKTAMEAKAATSRMKSVIGLSLLVMFQFCSHFVRLSTGFWRYSSCQCGRIAFGSRVGNSKPLTPKRKNPEVKHRRVRKKFKWGEPVFSGKHRMDRLASSEIDDLAVGQRHASVHAGGKFMIVGGNQRCEAGLSHQCLQRVEYVMRGFRI